MLAIVLAARFAKPVPILFGILFATLLNHELAAAAGFALASWLAGPAFQTIVGVAFLAMAAWALVPDKADSVAAERTAQSVFLATLIAIFLVEIGDKTQIVTSLLAARFQEVVTVTIGTTAGIMLANVPADLLGSAVTRVVPLRVVRITAAVVFALLGAAVLLAQFGD